MDETTELRVARDNFSRYRYARDLRHSKYVSEAREADRFYMGDQWNSQDLAILESQGRPALTLNIVGATINTALGEHIKTQADIRFKPARQGAEETANVLNHVYQYIAEQNHLDDLEPQVVSDGFIGGRGYYDVRMSFDRNISGEVDIRVENPVDVIPDPQAYDSDPSTWSEVFLTRWMSIEDIETEYGLKKADKLRQLARGTNLGNDSMEMETPTFGDENGYTHAMTDEDAATLRRVRIIERQFYKMRKVAQIVDLRSGDVRDLPPKYQGNRELQQEIMRTFENVVIREVRKKAVMLTITADTVVLFHDWSIYRSFSVIPYFPYFRRGNPFGMVKNLISPQQLLNKTSSQELHIVNTTANSGWVVQEDSLADMDSDDLARKGAETGLVLTYKRGFEKPEKIQPNQIPSGIDRISAKALMSIRQISGINESLSGNDRADVSGVAIQQRRESGQTQLAVPFKNIARTRRFLARKILELVQDFYDDTRTIYITDYNDPSKSREEVQINQPQSDGSIWNDVTRGEYDIVVGTQPNRDSYDETQFAESLQMREAGIQIPDFMIVEHSNLARRTELAQLLKEMSGMGEKSEEQQQLEQLQQELLVETAKLEVEEKRAKVAQLNSSAQLNTAKTDELAGYNKAEHVYDEMEHEREMAKDELDAKVQLAILSSKAAMAQNTENNEYKMAAEAMKAKAAANKPTTTKKD